jgi:TolB protein
MPLYGTFLAGYGERAALSVGIMPDGYQRSMTERPSRKQENKPASGTRGRLWLFRGFLLLVLILISALGWYSLRLRDELPANQPDPPQIAFATGIAVESPTSFESETPEPTVSITPLATRTTLEGSLVYTVREGGHSHIWVYGAGDPKPLPLTWGDWDDRDPAIDPLGEQLAFSSNRGGAWDLYLLELRTGTVRQLTYTSGFEGHPTWSPDGTWIAFEAYYDGDFDIRILNVAGEQDPIQLTNHPASDTNPEWDPAGRRIAFVSDREGSPDIFIANLDQPDDRFTNLTQTPAIPEGHPSFNAESTWLAYTQLVNGLTEIHLKDLLDLDRPSIPLGAGGHPVWSPDGSSLAAIVQAPLRSHLISYAVEGSLPLIGFPIAEPVYQITWTAHGLPGEVITQSANYVMPNSLYEVDLGSSVGQARTTLVALNGVEAPNPALSDAVDEAFEALRQRLAIELGWDFLGALEHAFVGINDPLPPGLSYDDWLYTGRAFTFNRDAVEARLVEVVREDLAGQTYWRVFVWTANQEGAQGEPLRDYPWDFSARYSGDPKAYDQGGALADRLPAGYYIDFTQLAQDYGFERVPALPNWRTYFSGTRFNEFVYRQGLDWLDAMLELYPLSAIVTPTPFLTPTPTPTRTLRPTPTPWWWRWQTPTATSTPFIAPTPTP